VDGAEHDPRESGGLKGGGGGATRGGGVWVGGERTWACTDGRSRFIEASGRCRFTEGRTRGGSLPLRALIVVKMYVLQSCRHRLYKQSVVFYGTG
jgi:hypothetical protein